MDSNVKSNLNELEIDSSTLQLTAAAQSFNLFVNNEFYK